ncbi:MAG: helix-turn-helix domain-containing protein [Stenotrophobium sp.]
MRLVFQRPQLVISSPQTIAQHLRRCRLARGLRRRDVTQLLGIAMGTVAGWESGREPEIESMPAILDFLGYDPYQASDQLPDRLRPLRRRAGLTIANAAARARVSRLTWASWEAGHAIRRMGRTSQSVATLLASASAALSKSG